MIVYCLSGLGADERVFARLSLEAELRHIQWIKPRAAENIEDYSKRLAEQIDASRPFVLLGVSFGGLIARELAQLVPAKAVLLISSFSSAKSLPFFVGMPFLAPLLRLLPDGLLVPPPRLMAWLFGVSHPQERQLLYQILQDTDPAFLRWALGQILRLRRLQALPRLLQLHGSSDRLIPCPSGAGIIKITGGGHFMIYNRAPEVSALLNQFLRRIDQG